MNSKQYLKIENELKNIEKELTKTWEKEKNRI